MLGKVIAIKSFAQRFDSPINSSMGTLSPFQREPTNPSRLSYIKPKPIDRIMYLDMYLAKTPNPNTRKAKNGPLKMMHRSRENLRVSGEEGRFVQILAGKLGGTRLGNMTKDKSQRREFRKNETGKVKAQREVFMSHFCEPEKPQI